MNPLLFLGLSTFYGGLLWVIYRLGGRESRHWRLRRRLCIALPAMALAIALLPGLLPYTSLERPGLFLSPISASTSPFIAIEPRSASSGTLDTAQLSWLIMLGGTALLMARTALRYLILWQQVRRLPLGYLDHKPVRISEQKGQAYQFGKHIIISRDLFQGPHASLILLHERHHLSAGHHRERLLAIILRNLAWWSPFSWLWLRALRAVHEYEADATVQRQGDPDQYRQLLLQQKLQVASWAPSSPLHSGGPFSSVTLKNRIDMMHQKPSSATRPYLWLLPALLFMVSLSWSCTQSADQEPRKPRTIGYSKVTKTPRTEDCPDQTGPAARKCFEQAVMSNFQESFAYPKALKESGVKGRAYVSFVVSADGKVQKVKMERSIPLPEDADPSLDSLTDVAIRKAVRAIPPFAYPAEKDDEPVAMRFVLPIMLKSS